MGEYIKKKKDMNFQSVDSLQSVVNVVNEAAAALNDKKRTIKESAIPEALFRCIGGRYRWNRFFCCVIWTWYSRTFSSRNNIWISRSR